MVLFVNKETAENVLEMCVVLNKGVYVVCTKVVIIYI